VKKYFTEKSRYLKKYERYLRYEEKSKITIEKYMRDIRHLYKYLEDRGMLDKDTMMDYKDYLIQNYATSSVNSMLVAANGYLAFIGLPECRVKLLKRQRKVFSSEEQELTKSEYMRLLKASDRKETQRIHFILQTICATGIRIGELPYVTIQAMKSGKAEVYNKGKSRVILIPRKLCKRLKRYAEKQGIREGSIFITRNHKPVNRSNVWAEMKKLSKKAGVAGEKVFPHNLRHLFARTYYKMEKDILKLADLLGHSNIETTRIYTMTTGKEHERQIACLGLCT